MADSVSDSIVVNASPATVWDVIADFDRYPEWNTEVRDVEVLEVGDDGWGTKARFSIDAGVLRARVVLEYAYTDHTMTWWLVEGDKVRKNDGTYTLEPQDDGTTRVVYELEVEPAVPLPGMMKRQAARRIITRALKGMKQHAESA